MPKKIEDGLTAKQRYNAKNMKKITFEFNLKTEAHLIEQINSQPSKAGYIKRLIAEDIERNKQ